MVDTGDRRSSSTSSTIDEEVTDWRNVRAVSVFTFVDSLQFSFYMWTIWPYLQSIDKTISATFLGFIIASSGVGEAVGAPVFGVWSNRFAIESPPPFSCFGIGRILPPVYASIALSFAGNAVYFLLELFSDDATPFAMMASRFLSGFGTGNRGCFRALVAANSRGQDRAKALASSGGAALVGLTIGPAVQVLFSWIGPEGWDMGWIRLSQYTVPAVLAMGINLGTWLYVGAVLDDSLSTHIKKEVKKESSTHFVEDDGLEEGRSVDGPQRVLRMDVLAVVICMATRSLRMLVTANIESIGAPYSEIMFNYTHNVALETNSYAQSANGVVTVATFIVYAFTDYTKWVSERANCLGALVGLLIFYVLSMPWPFMPGEVDCTHFVGNGTKNWHWCVHLTYVNEWTYYVTYVVLYGVALSVLNNSLQALYSRVLGSGPQGTMQGVNQAVGCIARILGPIIMSTTFTSYGPQATWGTIIGLLAFSVLVWIIARRRLVPLECRKRSTDRVAGIA